MQDYHTPAKTQDPPKETPYGFIGQDGRPVTFSDILESTDEELCEAGRSGEGPVWLQAYCDE